MLCVGKEAYAQYIEDLGISKEWLERDFVEDVKKYINSTCKKVLLVSGLRGTGKSVGLLQAIKDEDAVYITIEKGIETRANELLEFLKSRSERIIVIDEYTWLSGRKESELDDFMFTLVNHGKRVILTGTESISLEMMKTGALIHRALTIHTTHMSFPEYCRLNKKTMNQKVCDEYLLHGGVFEEYVFASMQTAQNYVEEALVDNLKGYIRDYGSVVSESKASNIIYTLLYRAIWELARNNPKLLQSSEDPVVQENLERLGIDLEGTEFTVNELRNVADLFCSVGVLVKVPNLLNDEMDYRTYVVNPALTCWFIKTVFPNYDNMSSVMGLVYEATCMVDLYFKKQYADAIYYIESQEANNFEIDIVIVSNDDCYKKQFYLFECKHEYKINVYNENWSIVNGRVDNILKEKFPDSEICGRYIIHPGESDWQTHKSGREIFIVNQGDELYKYYEFGKRSEACNDSDRDNLANELENLASSLRDSLKQQR